MTARLVPAAAALALVLPGCGASTVHRATDPGVAAKAQATLLDLGKGQPLPAGA
jgi:hypothetical protein